MSASNGSASRTCSGCAHWANVRSMPGQIGQRIGDCQESIHPIVVGVGPQGVQQVPGGTWVITLPGTTCSHWRPRLALVAGDGSAIADAQALPAPPKVIE